MTLTERSHIEIEIVDLLSNRDDRCLSLVYKHYSSALFGIIIKIVGSNEVAEEVLQDVFLKFWNASKSYDANKARLFTWLANISRNAAIDKLRSAQYKKGEKTDSIENYVNFKNKIYEEASTDDFGLKKVIDSLEEKHKKLIYLTYFEGYSQREIQKEFDIPLGTVKTRIRDAVRILRSKLNPELLKKLLYALPITYLIIEIIRQSGY